jgi:hypothetical protein
MFYLNLGYYWQVPEIGEHGVCVGAHGVDSPGALTTDRRDRLPIPDKRLFDPQLYLRDLDLQDSESVVTRLATYPWFNSSVSEYSDNQTVTDWKKQVTEALQGRWPCELPDGNRDAVYRIIEACLAFQERFGVGRLIIPASMSRDPESDFSCESAWIDIGLELAADNFDLPVYATLGISDTCLMHRRPNENELLKIVVDQIAARTELSGVYLI